MIVLDTNVLSEPLRPKPDRNAMAWLDRQAPETLYLPTICVAELWAGIAALSAGKRRTQLQLVVNQQVLSLFAGRILDFDVDAASAFGTVAAHAKAAGNAMDFADCAIAAIASAHGFSVATRNTKDYRGSGVPLVNPWDAPSESHVSQTPP